MFICNQLYYANLKCINLYKTNTTLTKDANTGDYGRNTNSLKIFLIN